MLLAEANQWPEDAVAYFGDGRRVPHGVPFPADAAHVHGRSHRRTASRSSTSWPRRRRSRPSCQWALFLRNHDELTLEMVTDEERDYMYRVYAQDPQARINLGIRRRLAPLLGNDRRLIELMNGLLFSLPGTPIIYYGDEIGMGDNIYLGDRNGVRTPMQWTATATPASRAPIRSASICPVIIDPEYHYAGGQRRGPAAEPESLLWWMRRLDRPAERYQAFGGAALEILLPGQSQGVRLHPPLRI